VPICHRPEKMRGSKRKYPIGGPHSPKLLIITPILSAKIAVLIQKAHFLFFEKSIYFLMFINFFIVFFYYLENVKLSFMHRDFSQNDFE